MVIKRISCCSTYCQTWDPALGVPRLMVPDRWFQDWEGPQTGEVPQTGGGGVPRPGGGGSPDRGIPLASVIALSLLRFYNQNVPQVMLTARAHGLKSL